MATRASETNNFPLFWRFCTLGSFFRDLFLATKGVYKVRFETKTAALWSKFRVDSENGHESLWNYRFCFVLNDLHVGDFFRDLFLATRGVYKGPFETKTIALWSKFRVDSENGHEKLWNQGFCFVVIVLHLKVCFLTCFWPQEGSTRGRLRQRPLHCEANFA